MWPRKELVEEPTFLLIHSIFLSFLYICYWYVGCYTIGLACWIPCILPYCLVCALLVQTLRLCTSRTVHRGSRGIALLFHDHGTRRGWVVSVMPRTLFTPGKVPVPIVQEAGWAPRMVWTGAENLAITGIRSPDRPARNQSAWFVPGWFLKYCPTLCLVPQVWCTVFIFCLD